MCVDQSMSIINGSQMYWTEIYGRSPVIRRNIQWTSWEIILFWTSIVLLRLIEDNEEFIQDEEIRLFSILFSERLKQQRIYTDIFWTRIPSPGPIPSFSFNS